MKNSSFIRFGILLIFSMACLLISAQLPSSVDISLHDTGNDSLEVRLTANGADFNEVLSSLVFTLRWNTSAGVSLGLPDQLNLPNACPLFVMNVAPNPAGVIQNGQFSYRNYTVVGTSQLASCPSDPGFGLIDGVPLTIARIPISYSGSCPQLSIANDPFALMNNYVYFVSTNGINATGIVTSIPTVGLYEVCDDGDPSTYYSFLDANCSCIGLTADCNGLSGGTGVPGSPCDDGLPTTANDLFDANCNCTGQPIDCLGIGGPGATALPGTGCQDNNPSTANTIWDANCNCVGTLIDCTGVIGGSNLPGSPCNDLDPSTINDVWDQNCNCIGALVDCEGTTNGPALPGTPCDDGNPNTGNDTWSLACNCVGLLIDCNGIPGGPDVPGTSCDDGDFLTIQDTISAACICEGISIDCEGTVNGTALPGTACDDGDANSINDSWTSNCTCLGQVVDCNGILGGPALPGTTCDDGDPQTGNDQWQNDCTCAGQYYDCNGLPGGPVYPGAACNDGNILTIQDTINANCACVGISVDCEGTPNGTALPGTLCDDGDPTTSGEVWDALCNCATAINTICFQLNNGPRKPADIEESETGNVYGDAGAFDLVYDSEAPWNYRGNQIAGLHFPSVNIPAGSSIVDARIQFTAYDTVDFGPTNMIISAHRSSNSVKFDYDQYELSSRAKTQSQVSWSPPTWSVINESGPGQQTPNLALLVQEVIGLQGWNGGNMAFFFEGTGGRQAYSSEQDFTKAAVLCITYSTVTLAPDCQGIQGGPNGQGAPCDDGDPNTSNDTWDVNCLCVGQPMDCTGNVTGTAFPGSSCDDGNPNTGNDIYQSDCTCLGQLIDCTGVIGGSALPGSSCDDGNSNTSFDTYDASCNCSGTANAQSLCFSLSPSPDPDSEEATNGNVYQNVGALDLVYDSEQPWNWRGHQQTAIRFTGISIPQGASVIDAHIQFTAYDTLNYDPIQLSIATEAIDNTSPLSYNAGDVSSRILGSNQVNWSPTSWSVIDESGVAQRTPDLSAIVQEVLSRPGWSSMNSMTFVITGIGGRQAYSSDQDISKAPVLCITFTTDTLAFDCDGFAGGGALPGTPCDDGSASTVNDTYDANCLCVGIQLDCNGVANGTSLPGTACDDGNPATGNDVYTTDCNCLGLIIDCAGIPGGNASIDACGVCNGNNDCLSGLDCFDLSIDGDKEEAQNGGVYSNSGALDLVLDSDLPYQWRGDQTVGLHFDAISIPHGAIITEAIIQFTTKDTLNFNPCSLSIAAEDVDDALPIGWSLNELSSRTLTAGVSWSPPTWNTLNETGLDQRTPDLSLIVQQIIDRPGWSDGNALLFILNGSGGRQAFSSEQDANKAAKLCLSWEMPSTAISRNTHRSVYGQPVPTRIFPNPNRGDVVNLKIVNRSEQPSTGVISIVDMYGKQLYLKTATVAPGQHVELIQLNGALAKGVYFVNIELNSEIVTERFVIN